MLIDRTHLRWGLASAAALGAAAAGYAWSVAGPRLAAGGSAAGLTFGILSLVAMILAGLLAVRKKFPATRLGSAQFWLRMHIWLGLLSVPLALFHSGFRFGGTLEKVFMAVFFVVILSGVYGLALQQVLPRFLKVRVPLETFPQQIAHLCQRLREESEQLFKDLEGPTKKATAPAKAADAAAKPVASELAASAASTPAPAGDKPAPAGKSALAAKLAAAAAAKKAASPAAPTATDAAANPATETVPAGEKPAPAAKSALAAKLAAAAAAKKAASAATSAATGTVENPAPDTAPPGEQPAATAKSALAAKLAAAKKPAAAKPAEDVASPSAVKQAIAHPSLLPSLASAAPDGPMPRLSLLLGFCRDELFPFLDSDSHVASRQNLISENFARMAFANLGVALPSRALPAITRMEEIVAERRQFLVQLRIQSWLRSWLLVHIPLSAALFILAAVHVFAALRVVPWP